MEIIKSPNHYPEEGGPFIFLAGSIEMGVAENWQDKIAGAFTDTPIIILNPRRDGWDSSWVQEKENPQFREQVEWELKAMEDADLIVMYFDIGTRSPISLLELGLFASSDKLIVCCPKGFWRKGNVDIVCERYGVPQVETLEELIQMVKDNMKGLWPPQEAGAEPSVK